MKKEHILYSNRFVLNPVFGFIVILVFFMVLFSSSSVYGENLKTNPLVKRDEGKVYTKKESKEDWKYLIGSIMLEKDGSVRTQEKSKATIEVWDGKTFLTIFENSILELKDIKVEKETSIAIFQQGVGRVWVKVEQMTGKKADFKIRTPQAVLAVRGTEFYSIVAEADASQNRGAYTKAGVDKGAIEVEVLVDKDGKVIVTETTDTTKKTVKIPEGYYIIIEEGLPIPELKADPEWKKPTAPVLSDIPEDPMNTTGDAGNPNINPLGHPDTGSGGYDGGCQ